jgi:hypothetical protein
MTATLALSGFIVRETEAAVAFVSLPLQADMKPLWLPRKKIASMVEADGYSPSVQLKGEGIRRLGTPVDLEICEEFAKKVGAA